MKILVGIIAIFCFSLQALAEDRKTVRKIIKWECEHLPYKKVDSFPEVDYIEIKFQVNSGKYKAKLKPDIFSKNFAAKSKQFFSNFTKKEQESRPVVAYNSCLKDFYQKIERDLLNHNKYCNNCLNVEQAISSFKEDIKNKDLIKKAKTQKKIPAFIPYHNFVTYIPPTHFDEFMDKICNDKPLNNKDRVYLSSAKAIGLVLNEASRTSDKIDDKCLTKFSQYNVNIIDAWDCQEVDCNAYAEDKQKIIELEELLNKKRADARAKKQKNIIFKASTDLNFAEDLDEKSKEILLNSITSKGGYCFFSNHTIYFKSGKYSNKKQLDDYPGLIGEFLEKNEKIQNPKCAGKLLNQLLATSYKIDDLLEDEYCKKNGCPLIQKKKTRYDKAISNLIINIYGKNQIKYFCERKDNLSPSNSNFGKDLQALIDDLEQINQCSELPVGEHKVVDESVFNSPSGIRQHYLLEKIDPKNFRATLALDFGDDEKGEKMHADVAKCLDNMSNYFTNDKNEKIKVKIISKEDREKMPINKRPPVVNIGIGEKGMRSHSSKYAEDASCGTMTHEVLHLMGLCDEYRENVTGYYVDTATGEIIDKEEGPDRKKEGTAKFVLAYNACRSIAKSSSIMSKHWEKINRTIKSRTLCKCEQTICRDIVNKKDPKQMRYFVNNPWSNMYSFKYRGCKEEYISTKSFKSLSKFGSYPENPIAPISQTENSVVFTNYELDFEDASAPRIHHRKYSCKCEQTECEKDIKRLKEIVLNGHATGIRCPAGLESTESLQYFGDEPSGVGKLEGGEFPFINDPESKSLLHTAHFDRIKYGSCKSKVKIYSECAQNAYKKLAKDCPDIPEYCKDEEKWLKSGQ